VSMLPATFHVSLFEHEPLDTKRSSTVLVIMLEALVQANTLWIAQMMREGHSLESLSIYNPASRVVYQLDSRESNDWLDIVNVMKRGYADCKSLSAWRIAELRHAGIAARPFIRWPRMVRDPSRRVLHALVRWPGGRIEDPSLALGMRGTVSRRPVFVAPEGAEA